VRTFIAQDDYKRKLDRGKMNSENLGKEGEEEREISKESKFQG
jgi:hypothetical protein